MRVPELLPPLARYALARDRNHWDAEITGLERDGDGNLRLARIPGPIDGVAVMLPPPYSIGASGIAAGPCETIFLSDTAHNRVVFIDRRCNAKALLPPSGAAGSTPGAFDAPRGLAVRDDLLVGDSGNARVQALAFPALEPYFALTTASAGALEHPAGVACDSLGRAYVLDDVRAAVYRFERDGTADGTYDAALAAQGKLSKPIFLAAGEDDVLLVSDEAAKTVFVFDASGVFLHALPPPASGSWQPGAITTDGVRAYVHDAAAGTIEVFSDLHTWCGHVAGFRGPVTALAVDDEGNLLIKTGLDERYFVFGGTAAFASPGSLVFGPLDAGVEVEWFRAAVDVTLPPRTAAALDAAQLDMPAPPPTATEWIAAPALDTLLEPVMPPAAPIARRWLWLRVTLTTTDPEVTPTLRQVRAETPGESYLDYLPEIFRHGDREDHELFRLLALVRTEQGLVDERIDAMPQVFSPAFALASTLPWLAEWLDFELPGAAPDDERRALVAGAVALHERRGTPASIASFVELHTGIRPHIVEAAAVRGIWILGESSRLGFDTVLPASDPDGIVIPDSQVNAGPPPTCCPPPTGHAVVGESGPLAADRFGEPLFLDTAHRFDVIVPAHHVRDRDRLELVRRIVEREKPAHTQYCLCVVEPQVYVGFQAQVGIDTILGSGAPALRLDEARLDLAPLAGDASGGAGRIGMNARVGETTLLR